MTAPPDVEEFWIVETSPGEYWERVETEFSVSIRTTMGPLNATKMPRERADYVLAKLRKATYPSARVMKVTVTFTLTPEAAEGNAA